MPHLFIHKQEKRSNFDAEEAWKRRAEERVS